MDRISHFFDGAVSGMFGVTLSHPIDTIKTSIQDQKPKPSSFRSLYRGVLPALSGVGLEKAIVFGTYENSKKLFKNLNLNDNASVTCSGAISGLSASLIVTPVERLKILAQTGNKLTLNDIKPTNLYRGLSATFTRETPGFAIYFTSYEYLKRKYLGNSNKELPLHVAFMYGGFSGALSWFGIYPQDVIKTRMQANTNIKNITFLNTAQSIYKDGGIKPFFRGFHLALFRAVPLHAGTFSMMEFMKNKHYHLGRVYEYSY